MQHICFCRDHIPAFSAPLCSFGGRVFLAKTRLSPYLSIFQGTRFTLCPYDNTTMGGRVRPILSISLSYILRPCVCLRSRHLAAPRMFTYPRALTYLQDGCHLCTVRLMTLLSVRHGIVTLVPSHVCAFGTHHVFNLATMRPYCSRHNTQDLSGMDAYCQFMICVQAYHCQYEICVCLCCSPALQAAASCPRCEPVLSYQSYAVLSSIPKGILPAVSSTAV